MISEGDLLSLGFSKNSIEKNITSKKLVALDNTNFSINSTSLLNDIFLRALFKNEKLAKSLFSQASIENQFYYLVFMGRIDEAAVLSEYVSADSKLFKILNFLLFNAEIEEKDVVLSCEDKNLKSLYNLLYKYIFYREPDMVLFIIGEIAKFSELSNELILIEKCAGAVPVDSDYFYNYSEYASNNVAREHLTLIERRLLFAIETENYKECQDILGELRNIYDHHDAIKIVGLLIRDLKLMEKHSTLLGDHDNHIIAGNTFVVLYSLIKSQDYYRFEEVVDDLIFTSDGFSYILEIYRIMIDRILEKDIINYRNVESEIRSSITGTNEDIKLFGKFRISSVSHDLIAEMESVDLDISDDVDYYALYLESFKKGDYKSALQHLNKYMSYLKITKSSKNVMYLKEELEILISNEFGLLVNKMEAKKNYETGLKAYKDGYYEEAIQCFELSNRYNTRFNPFIKSLVARCYYNLGYYDDAVSIYSNLLCTLKPDDYVLYVYSLVNIKKYDEAIKLCENYFKIYGEENPKIFYIRYIIGIRQKNYKDALDGIEYLEKYNFIFNHNLCTLQYERDVIENCMNGKEIDVSLQDYFDFSISDDERDLLSKIKDNEITRDFVDKLLKDADSISSLVDRLKYLISIIKCLFMVDEGLYSLKVIEEANKLIDDNSDTLVNSDIKKYMRVISVYNSNFLTIEE